MGMNRILLSTGNLTYRFDLEKIAEISKKSGVDGLEVVINKRIVELYEKYKEPVFNLKTIPVVSFHAPYHIIHSWGTLRHEFLRTLEVAKKVGAETVVFHPPLNPVFQPDFWRFFHSIKDFGSLADGKVIISVETVSKSLITRFTCSPEKLKEWSEEKNLFITLDCTHVNTWGYTPLDAFKIFGEKVKSIHLNNTDDDHLDLHLPPHMGKVDVKGVLGYLKNKGLKDIDLVLEVNFHLKEEGQIEKIIRESVDFVKSHL